MLMRAIGFVALAGVSACSHSVPTESHSVPTESHSVPTESHSVPTESHSVPTELEITARVAGIDPEAQVAYLELPVSSQFEEMTAAHVGEVLEVRMDGVVVMRPVVREPIHGNRFKISWDNNTIPGFLEGRDQVRLTITVSE